MCFLFEMRGVWQREIRSLVSKLDLVLVRVHGVFLRCIEEI